jgi:3-dehydroquinate synthase
MGALHVLDGFTIQSHKGPYTVTFDERPLEELTSSLTGTRHFIVDANIARLYARELAAVLDRPTTVVIKATEENKSIHRIIPVIEALVTNRVRRDHALVAIGGGIIQDVTCFIASTLLRGLRWDFIPTTLLAQADSCIGSKSSVNLGEAKNILGTFNPPAAVHISTRFLDTLEDRDVRSGIGEIIKVHAIEGAAAYDKLAGHYDHLATDRTVLLGYIRDALLIKQRYIERDEYDKGVRNVFNYGHSFGHAIEAATHFGIPHGVAVTIGMDMANNIAAMRSLIPEQECLRMGQMLRKNYGDFRRLPIPLDPLLSALTKDKKNTSSALVLILPVGEPASIQRHEVQGDAVFRSQCVRFLEDLKA